MKAQMKAVMASAVVIVLALAAVSGVTYSWFSDSENTDISITTGAIELNVEYSEFKLESYNKSPTTVSLGSQGTFPNGVGTFNSTSDKAIPYKTITEITMENMVPGDKVSFSMDTISLETDLDVRVSLDVIVYEGNAESTGYPFKITYDDFSKDYLKGVYANLGPLNFMIELPTETDPEYMDREYSIAIVLEAIQSAAVPSEPSTFKFVENNEVLTANVESEVYGQKVTVNFTADSNSELNSDEEYSLVVSPSDGSVLDDFGPNTKSISFELTGPDGKTISKGFTAAIKLPVDDDVQNIVHISNGTKSIVPGVNFSVVDNIRYAVFTVNSFSDFVLFSGEISSDEVLNVILKSDDIDNVRIELEVGEYTLNIVNEKTITINGSGSGTVLDFTKVVGAGNSQITFNNLKIQGKNENSMSGFGIQGTTKGIVYNGCIFDGAVTNEYYGSVQYNDCTFTGTGYITTYAVKEATFKNCTFDKADSRAVLVFSHGDNPVNVTLDSCEFKADKMGYTWQGDWTAAIEVDTTNIKTIGTEVTITNCNYDKNMFNGLVRDKSEAGKANSAIQVDGITMAFQGTQLANALKSTEESIEVSLCNDMDVPISTLNKEQTSGSGEYKLGGEDTNKIIVDLNGKKLNITTNYWSAIGASNDNATITFKNGSMTSTGNSATTWNAYDIRFCNCNYVIEGVDFLKPIALDNAGKSSSLNDVSITESGDFYAIWITAEGQSVTIDGLEVSSGRGIKIDNQYVDNTQNQKVILDINEAIFKTSTKSAILVKSPAGAEIVIGNMNIDEVLADRNNEVWIDEDAKDYANSVIVTGGSCIVEPG